MNNMWIFLDIIVIAILAICAFSSAKRGFVRTIIEFVGFLLAIYISFTVSGSVAESVYEKNIEPKIVNSVTEKVSATSLNTVDDTVNTIWSGLPAIVKNSATFFGVESDTIADTVNQRLSDTNDIKNIAETTAEKAVEPIVVPLIKSIVGTTIFIVLMFVVKMLARILGKMFKLPIIGGINRILGAILGLGKGLVISVIVCMALSTLIAITDKDILFLTKENIDKSLLFSLFANFNLF